MSLRKFRKTEAILGRVDDTPRRIEYMNKKALQSGVWYTISNFLVRGIGFITTPIFTRLLTQAEFGQFNNYTSWQSILIIFVTLNLESTLICAQFDYKEKFDEYILSMLALSTASGCAWLAGILMFERQAEIIFGLDKCYVYAMLLYLLFLPAINLFQTRERLRFRYKSSVLVSLAVSVGAALLSVILVLCMKNRLTGRIIGYVVPTVLIGLVLLFYFGFKGKRVSCAYWRYAFPICMPYIPHLLSLTVLNSMDRIMIKRWCGDVDTALYSLAYSCGAVGTMLFSSINTAYAPWLAERLSEDDYTTIRKVSGYYIFGGVCLATGIMLLAPEALFILGGSKYIEAKYVISPVFMGCVCQFLYTMFVNVEQIKKRTVGMAFASISAAVLNFFLNWLLIPKVGYLAAAYTTLAGYLWLLLVHMVLVRHMGLSQIYNCRGILSLVIAFGVFTVGINFLYRFTVIRYFGLGVYLAVLFFIAYKKRNKIRTMLRKDKPRL